MYSNTTISIDRNRLKEAKKLGFGDLSSHVRLLIEDFIRLKSLILKCKCGATFSTMVWERKPELKGVCPNCKAKLPFIETKNKQL